MSAPLTLPIATALAIAFAGPAVYATELVRPRPLIEYADILLAQELDNAISVLNERLTQCVDTGGGDPNQCYCRYPAEADAAQVAYTKTMQARPKWKGKILYWKNMDTQASRQLVMPAVENQLLPAAQSCSAAAKQ